MWMDQRSSVITFVNICIPLMFNVINHLFVNESISTLMHPSLCYVLQISSLLDNIASIIWTAQFAIAISQLREIDVEKPTKQTQEQIWQIIVGRLHNYTFIFTFL